jgi:hypothetical protein
MEDLDIAVVNGKAPEIGIIKKVKIQLYKIIS